jgi:hypothetical protein
MQLSSRIILYRARGRKSEGVGHRSQGTGEKAQGQYGVYPPLPSIVTSAHKMETYVGPKRWHLATNLHGTTTQNFITIIILNAVKNSNLTNFIISFKV